MKINWITKDNGTKVGYTDDGARFSDFGDSFNCSLYGGGFGYGDTTKEAFKAAKADRVKIDRQRRTIKKANLTVN